MPRRPLSTHPAIGFPVRLLPETSHPMLNPPLDGEGIIAQVWQFEAGLMVSVQLEIGVIIDGLLFGELTDRNGTPLRWQ